MSKVRQANAIKATRRASGRSSRRRVGIAVLSTIVFIASVILGSDTVAGASTNPETASRAVAHAPSTGPQCQYYVALTPVYTPNGNNVCVTPGPGGISVHWFGFPPGNHGTYVEVFTGNLKSYIGDHDFHWSGTQTTVFIPTPSGEISGHADIPQMPEGTEGSCGCAGLYDEGLAFDVSVPVDVVGMAATPSGKGYWLVGADGTIENFGDAQNFGSMSGQPLNAPIVCMAPTADGGGYWLLGRDGGIFSFGDAQFYGSTGNLRLNQPVVGMAATPSGHGYWFVAADGGIFSFGDAQFYGSTGNIHLNKPVVGMAATPDGRGYYLDASDGGIFTFGDASFQGSMGGTPLNQPVVGMATNPATGGYWEVAADGGIFSFNAPFFGSTGNIHLNQPIVGMTNTPTGEGYRFVANDGGIFDFGDATFFGSGA